MVIGFVQGYEELKWGISKLNPLCNGPWRGGGGGYKTGGVGAKSSIEEGATIGFEVVLTQG